MHPAATTNTTTHLQRRGKSQHPISADQIDVAALKFCAFFLLRCEIANVCSHLGPLYSESQCLSHICVNEPRATYKEGGVLEPTSFLEWIFHISRTDASAFNLANLAWHHPLH